MQIGILGGTGPAGSALGARFADMGHEVVLGSRSKERADEASNAVLEAWPGRALALTGGDNETAASAELVVMATPWEGAEPTCRALRAQLGGKVLISMANALVRVGSEFQPLI